MNVTPCTAERHSLRGAAAEALSPVFCPLALPRLACVEHLVSLMAHVAPPAESGRGGCPDSA